MRSVHVDFARPARWPVVMFWALVVALLVAAGWCGARDLSAWQAVSAARSKTAELDARLASAQAAQAARAASATQPPAFAPDARHWMALSVFDGGGALRSIESAQLVGSKVVAIGINGESRHVELEVEVTGADVASAYLQALNAGLDRPAWALSRLQIQSGTEVALIHGQIE